MTPIDWGNAIRDGGFAAIIAILLWMLWSIISQHEKNRDQAIQQMAIAIEKIAQMIDAHSREHAEHRAECQRHFQDTIARIGGRNDSS